MASTTVKPPAAEPPKPGGIARATGLMMATVLLSRVLGLARDAIISYYFGRGPQTDAYLAAFTVPDLLFYLLQSGALSSTIVPIITELRSQGKHKLADKTVSIVASAIFLVIGLLICVMEIFARELTLLLQSGPGFAERSLDIAVPLTRILLPAQIFFFLGGLMMGVLYSRKQFLIPALGPVIYNSGIILGGVLLHRWLGLEGLVWGAVVGAFVGNFLLPFLAVRRLGVRLRPNFAFGHPAARKVWRMLLPVGLGVSLPNIDQLVNKAFASYLGPGDITAIMNAYRLMLLPIGVFAQAMALAVFPTLSGQAADNNLPAMRRTLNQSLRNILFLTVPSSALMFLLAAPIIAFLLQSGKFTGADTEATAAALRMLSLGIFAWSCQSLLTRGFYALQNSKVPVVSGMCVSVVFVAMDWFVIRFTHAGVFGLALATSLAAAIHMTALLFLLRPRLGGIGGGRLARSLAKTCISTLALVAGTWLTRTAIEALGLGNGLPKIEAAATILFAGLTGLGAFLLTARALRMTELQDALDLVKRRRRKS